MSTKKHEAAKKSTGAARGKKPAPLFWHWGILGLIVVICLAWLNLGYFHKILVSLASTLGLSPAPSSEHGQCLQHQYKTEIVSLDPLLIYIHGFLNQQDMDGVLAAGANRFVSSEVYQDGKLVQNPYRSSSSAGLPDDDAAVACVLERSRRFLGTVLDPETDEMGIPQLVRYKKGQQYQVHHDWFKMPKPAPDGSRRWFNRVASFFVVLQAECEGGETWFPLVEAASSGSGGGGGDGGDGAVWRRHEEGGLAFRSVAGNGLFWVNLWANGTGDTRTVHAGLPVRGGSKTAMNIWPRKYVASSS
ncbi:hypothetical protein PG987_002858 [Apiospora arundinis]